MPEDPLLAALCSSVTRWSEDLNLKPMLAHRYLPGDPHALLNAVGRNDFEALKAYSGGRRPILCAHMVVLLAGIREAREGRVFEAPAA